MKVIIRKASVAGRFYSSEKEEISDFMQHLVEKERPSIDYSYSAKTLLGAVLPHAGHIYSGYQTIHFFEVLKQSAQEFDTWIIIHPIHQGSELEYAAEGSNFWSTPLGNVKVDNKFIEASGIPVSNNMHRFEHSSEVILPFIQKYCNNDFSIVSIGMARQHLNSALGLSRSLLKAIKETKKRIMILASSDFSHYVNPADGLKMDQMVIDRILKKDVQGIYMEVIKNDLSICGFGPIMVLCTLVETLYPDASPVILSPGHSGEVSHSSNVVDYITILFYR